MRAAPAAARGIEGVGRVLGEQDTLGGGHVPAHAALPAVRALCGAHGRDGGALDAAARLGVRQAGDRRIAAENGRDRALARGGDPARWHGVRAAGRGRSSRTLPGAGRSEGRDHPSGAADPARGRDQRAFAGAARGRGGGALDGAGSGGGRHDRGNRRPCDADGGEARSEADARARGARGLCDAAAGAAGGEAAGRIGGARSGVHPGGAQLRRVGAVAGVHRRDARAVAAPGCGNRQPAVQSGRQEYRRDYRLPRADARQPQ